MDLLTRTRRPARRGRAHGGLAARLREPAQVVYLALLGLVAAGWVLVALDGGQFLTLDSVVGIQQRSAALGIVAVGQTLAIWPARSTCPWPT